MCKCPICNRSRAVLTPSAPVPTRDWLDAALVVAMVLCSATLLGVVVFLLGT